MRSFGHDQYRARGAWSKGASGSVAPTPTRKPGRAIFQCECRQNRYSGERSDHRYHRDGGEGCQRRYSSYGRGLGRPTKDGGDDCNRRHGCNHRERCHGRELCHGSHKPDGVHRRHDGDWG